MNRRFVSISLALSLSVCLSLVPPLSIAQTSAANASALPRLVHFGGVVGDLNENPLSGGTNLGGRADASWIGPEDARQCLLENRSSECTYHVK